MPVTIVTHALVQDGLARLRDAKTDAAGFRAQLGRLTSLLVSEATRDTALEAVSFETPMGHARGRIIPDSLLLLVPVIRAGLGMLEAAQSLVPSAAVGVVGIYREESSFEPRQYYHRLPDDLSGKTVIVLDPMLATGGTLVAAVNLLKNRGARDIRAVAIVAAPEGVTKVEASHPDLRLFTASIDEGLDENAYIIPGLGDAGDRIFGTD